MPRLFSGSDVGRPVFIPGGERRALMGQCNVNVGAANGCGVMSDALFDGRDSLVAAHGRPAQKCTFPSLGCCERTGSDHIARSRAMSSDDAVGAGKLLLPGGSLSTRIIRRVGQQCPRESIVDGTL